MILNRSPEREVARCFDGSSSTRCDIKRNGALLTFYRSGRFSVSHVPGIVGTIVQVAKANLTGSSQNDVNPRTGARRE
jgi:hypothetical protein